MSNPDPKWDYQQVWEELHEVMELIVDTRGLVGSQEKSNNEANQKAYEMIVGASASLYKVSQLISAMTKEQVNNGTENNSI